MKVMIKYLVLLICGSTIYLTAAAQKNDIKQFGFLLGNWEMSTPGGKITESWHLHADSLYGKSYRHQLNGDSILMETLVIKKVDGVFAYCPAVKGQNNNSPVVFKLISNHNGIYIFENLRHDFPQRIVYQDQGATALLAWIEGEKGGKSRKSTFRYKRKH